MNIIRTLEESWVRTNNINQKMMEVERLSIQMNMLLYTFSNSVFINFAKEYSLTKRELEIIKLLVVEGLRDEELSNHLYVTEKTVRNHLSSVRKKTVTKSCRELQALIYRYTFEFITRLKLMQLIPSSIKE